MMKSNQINVFLLTCLLGLNATAADAPSSAVGVDANKVFSGGQLDSINLFNGQLGVAVPLGAPLVVNDGLSVQLHAQYTANIWRYADTCRNTNTVTYNTSLFTPAMSVYTYTLGTNSKPANIGTVSINGGKPVPLTAIVPEPIRFNVLGTAEEFVFAPLDDPYPIHNPNIPPDEGPDCHPLAYVNPEFNSGLGWRVSLGAIYDPGPVNGEGSPQPFECTGPIGGACGEDYDPVTNQSARTVYIDASGAVHNFYHGLHGYEQEFIDPNKVPAPDDDYPVAYTRDGSYLRLQQFSTDRLVLDFPNGEKHTFERATKHAGSWDLGQWIPVLIEDTFGNKITITYTSDRWIIADTTDCNEPSNPANCKRHITVNFKQHGLSGFDVIDSVDTMAPAKDPGSASRRAVYQFNYNTQSNKIRRACPTNIVLNYTPDNFYNNGNGDKLETPQLTGITLPGNNGAYSFTNLLQNSPNHCKYMGVLTSMTLPSGGEVSWDYGRGEYPGTEPGNYKRGLQEGTDKKHFYGYIHPVSVSFKRGNRYPTGVRRRVETWKNNNGTDDLVKVQTYDPGFTCRQTDSQDYRHCIAGDDQAGIIQGIVSLNPDHHVKEFFNIITEATSPCDDSSNCSNVKPVATKTVRYYSLYPLGGYIETGDGLDFEGFTGHDYGLPFSKLQPTETVNSHKVYLSSQVFPSTVEDVFAQAAKPIRSSYLRYERDPNRMLDEPNNPRNLYPHLLGAGEMMDLNHRVIAEKTVFHQAGKSIQTYRSGWDGFGHYWVSETSATDSPTVVTLQSFNEGRGGLFSDNFEMFEEDEPWILNTYTRKIIEQRKGGVPVQPFSRYTTDYLFDQKTGFLKATRVHSHVGTQQTNPKLSSNDILTLNRRVEAGNGQVLRVSSIYGGDGQDLNTVNAFDPNGNNALLRKEVVTAKGLTVSTNIVDDASDCGPENNQCDIVLSGGRNIVDDGSMVVLSSIYPGHDISATNTVTDYSYDILGRTATIVTSGRAKQKLEYLTKANASKLKTCTLVAGANNCDLTQPAKLLAYAETRLDGFGRTIEEKRLLASLFMDYDPVSGDVLTYSTASNHFALRESQYDQTGALLGQTHWRADTDTIPDGKVMQRYEYDLFDRLELTKIDGKFTNYFSYEQDVFGKRHKYPAATGDPDGAVTDRIKAYSKNYVFDAYGRLIRVLEHSDSDDFGRQLKTEYAYDAMGKLVEISAYDSDGLLRQQRHFVYDGRGFLIAEQHPELGEVGNGLVLKQYDALGNILERGYDQGSAGGIAHKQSFVYDKAGRLTQVSADVTVPDVNGQYPHRLFMENKYATDSSTFGDYSYGKLVQTKRYNQETGIIVTESNYYDDPQGKLGLQQTRVQTSTGVESFEQSFRYDLLGNLIEHYYPERVCYEGMTCVSDEPSRQVEYGYDKSTLQRIFTNYNSMPGDSTALADPIAYYGNGLIAAVHHGPQGYQNAVTEVINNDPHRFVRPHSIVHYKGPASGGGNWNSGAFSYDGSGNVYQIGNDNYAYDPVHRLRLAQVKLDKPLLGAAPGDINKTVSYNYDPFNNMTNRQIEAPGLPIALQAISVDSNTNHLDMPGHQYDVAGNLIELGGQSLSYDAFNMVSSRQVGAGPVQAYVYTAGQERIVSGVLRNASSSRFDSSVWRLRSPNGKVLREYQLDDNGWAWQKDYFYRGSQLLAVIEDDNGQDRLKHMLLDHLGTPRHIVAHDSGRLLAETYREYLPFGQEVSETAGTEAMQFTGHERDLDCEQAPCSSSGGPFDLDYMHARYYAPFDQRFLSVDPILGNVSNPQSWNRYAYVSNNPIVKIDPLGLSEEYSWLDHAAAYAAVDHGLYDDVEEAYEYIETKGTFTKLFMIIMPPATEINGGGRSRRLSSGRNKGTPKSLRSIPSDKSNVTKSGRNANLVRFRSETEAGQVRRTTLEEINNGSKVVIGTGTHGDPLGRSAMSGMKPYKHTVFYNEDVPMSRIRPNDVEVYDVSTPRGAAQFLYSEMKADSLDAPKMSVVRAWCFSASCQQ